MVDCPDSANDTSDNAYNSARNDASIQAPDIQGEALVEDRWLRQIIELTKHQETLATLQKELVDLQAATKQHAQHLREDIQFHRHAEKRAAYMRQWEDEILACTINHHDSPLRYGFDWPEDPDRPITTILSPDRCWNKWNYQMAFPYLAKFLAKTSLSEKSLSQVDFKSVLPSGEIVEHWDSSEGLARRKILDHKKMWDHVKTRMVAAPQNQESDGGCVPSRLLHIIDLSPIVAAILLGSTPRLNLAYIVSFLERYLSFSNWAKANLFSLKAKPHTVNSFIFEYHFAFYFVPKEAVTADVALKDFRKIRRSSPFHQRTATTSRYIYEEQLSFILIGHGNDVYTCYQLGEKYFYATETGGATFVSSKSRAPSAMFLSWISMALHHVGCRWQSAIDAVNAEIDSPAQVIFMGDNSDLLSDDPHFSKSKTYFWAIQVYKLFDEALTNIIDTWERFRAHSLDKVNDGRMGDEYWESSIKLIDVEINGLRENLVKVRNKNQEVLNLRDGLFGAASLFDSRMAVRQGDNIRLLTYITLLFLPLSFGTSIFGMQTILPNTLPIKTFIITLPAIFIVTALLIFNSQNLVELFGATSQRITRALRKKMEHHYRHDWKQTARALQEDKSAAQVPVKKRQRKSSHWVYLLFLLESIFLTCPVNEVKAVICLYGLREKWENQRKEGEEKEKAASEQASEAQSPESRPASQVIDSGFDVNQSSASLAAVDPGLATVAQQLNASRPQSVKRVKEAERQSGHDTQETWLRPVKYILNWLKRIGAVLFTIVRFILLVIWVPLLVVDYAILLFIRAITGEPKPALQGTFCQKFDTPLKNKPVSFAPIKGKAGKQSEMARFFMEPLVVAGIDKLFGRNPADEDTTTLLRPTAIGKSTPGGSGRIRDVVRAGTWVQAKGYALHQPLQENLRQSHNGHAVNQPAGIPRTGTDYFRVDRSDGATQSKWRRGARFYGSNALPDIEEG